MRLSALGCVAALLITGLSVGCSRDLLHKAQRYEAAGKSASALVTYEEALSRTPEKDGHRRSQILTRMGECLYHIDRLAEAFNSFEKAVEADPNNSVARLRMGEMLLASGSPDRAREEAMIVLKTMAKDSEALALLGAAWAAVDNSAMAKAVYEQVLQNDPKRVTTAVALADLYNRENNPDKAREILKKAASEQPDTALPWLAMARLEEQEANAPLAEEAYRRAVRAEDTPETNFRLAQFLQRGARVAEAEQVLRRVDAQQKDAPTALADFQFLSGHPGEALQQYRAALDIPSQQPAERHFWQRATASSFTQTGSKNHGIVAARMIEAELAAAYELDARTRSSAIGSIRARLDQYRPTLDQTTIAILETELALADNDLVQAQVLSKSAVEAAPDSAPAHYIKGMAVSAIGDDEGAEKEWQSALDIDDHYLPARMALAELALRRHDGSKAEEQARNVVRDDPGNFHALMLFGKALLMEGKPSLAAVMAYRAKVLDPSSVEPSLLAGEISLKLDHIAEAMMAFEHAVAAHPNSEQAMDGLLRVYRRSAISYSALQKMEKAAQEPPVSATLLEITGRLYADRGWYSEAIRALSRAVAEDPNRTTAARLLAHLQLATGDFSRAASTVTQKAGTSQQPLLHAYQDDTGGNWQQAAAGYERAVREGDQSGVAANNLAWLYAAHNAQLDRALSLAEGAVKISPSNPSVLDTLGFVYLQRREYTKAVEALETAARLSTMKSAALSRDDALQIRKHLSDAYFRAGQTTAAVQIAQNRGPFAMK